MMRLYFEQINDALQEAISKGREYDAWAKVPFLKREDDGTCTFYVRGEHPWSLDAHASHMVYQDGVRKSFGPF
jgi:hypothetical protein